MTIRTGVCAVTAAFLLASPGVTAIGISVSGSGILEDAILIGSVGGAAPRDAVALGDIDLSVLDHVYDVPVDATATSWWLIGHQGADVVYSSLQDLGGVDLYSVEPYDVPGAELAWNIPANLDAFVNGGSYSFDWWAQTVANHSSHVAPDGGAATLWMFSDGTESGAVAVSLHDTTPPGLDGGPPSVPDAGSMIVLTVLSALGLSALRAIQRR